MSARWLTLFVLLGICLGCLPIFGFQTAKSSGSVFCPLMKKWVPNGDSSFHPVKAESLADICAPHETKTNFFNKAAENFRFSPNALNFNLTEDLFFSYAQKGEHAFVAAGSFPNAPERQFLPIAADVKSLINRQKDSSRSPVEKFVLKQLARPPTAAPPTLFKTSVVRELRFVSRRIQPRAPPAFNA